MNPLGNDSGPSDTNSEKSSGPNHANGLAFSPPLTTFKTEEVGTEKKGVTEGSVDEATKEQETRETLVKDRSLQNDRSQSNGTQGSNTGIVNSRLRSATSWRRNLSRVDPSDQRRASPFGQRSRPGCSSNWKQDLGYDESDEDCSEDYLLSAPKQPSSSANDIRQIAPTTSTRNVQLRSLKIIPVAKVMPMQRPATEQQQQPFPARIDHQTLLEGVVQIVRQLDMGRIDAGNNNDLLFIQLYRLLNPVFPLDLHRERPAAVVPLLGENRPRATSGANLAANPGNQVHFSQRLGGVQPPVRYPVERSHQGNQAARPEPYLSARITYRPASDTSEDDENTQEIVVATSQSSQRSSLSPGNRNRRTIAFNQDNERINRRQENQHNREVMPFTSSRPSGPSGRGTSTPTREDYRFCDTWSNRYQRESARYYQNPNRGRLAFSFENYRRNRMEEEEHGREINGIPASQPLPIYDQFRYARSLDEIGSVPLGVDYHATPRWFSEMAVRRAWANLREHYPELKMERRREPGAPYIPSALPDHYEHIVFRGPGLDLPTWPRSTAEIAIPIVEFLRSYKNDGTPVFFSAFYQGRHYFPYETFNLLDFIRRELRDVIRITPVPHDNDAILTLIHEN